MANPNPQFIYEFPADFLWGVSGNSFPITPTSDWAKWTQLGRTHYPPDGSLSHTFSLPQKENVALIKNLGVGIYRLTLDWSQIEPQPDQFDHAVLNQYVAFLSELQAHNIKVMLVLHSYTHPHWFHRLCPWHSSRSIERFVRYATRTFESFSSLVDFWVTLNEPNIFWTGAYLDGVTPPGISDWTKALPALHHILEAHACAYRVIKYAYAPQCRSRQVGINIHAANFQPFYPLRLSDHSATRRSHAFFNHMILDAIQSGTVHVSLPQFQDKIHIPAIQNTLDFIGVNYFTRVFTQFSRHQRYGTQFRPRESKAPHTDLGWDIHPDGLFKVLSHMQKYDLPLYITESGIADKADYLRAKFIFSHLQALVKAIDADIPIKGYIHYADVDGTEGLEGNTPKYGLCEVNPHTQEKKLRDSGHYYAGIARTNKMFTKGVI